ncbi:Carbamoyl-phosphate synthase small chain [Acetobacteraceae bacterium EV16G]|uniref:Carbamoyl phosphate synthase small chain n=1 Tax=Sorlinia euscelidii TaxID=3081148 RepID=A0ABU7U141_9PROT
MDVDLLIKKLGGADQLAELTNVGPEAVRKWRQSRTIPAKHWPALLQLPGISMEDLTDASPSASLDETGRPHGATAVLLLADGTILWGRGFGAHTTQAAIGEICFCTGMSGYQETLTDPSYAGQLVTFTFPHIGNVGTNAEDDEARRVAARGVIVKQDITSPANWRATAPLADWMQAQGLTGLSGIDTRFITHLLREKGPQSAGIFYPQDGIFPIESLLAEVRSWPGLEGMDLAKAVTCAQAHKWTEPVWGGAPPSGPLKRVVAIDYGAKLNILRCLVSAGCEVTVVPATSSAEEIMMYNPEGIFLSNGPGDPAATGTYAVPVIKALLKSAVPIFGICLGHQLLAQALGARTYKLEQGHRGANQPVKELTTGKVEITSQNHGFAVDEQSLPEDVIVTHTSLFDGSNEGIESRTYPAFSVQYHPEASPGPSDSFYLFERFVALMNKKAA